MKYLVPVLLMALLVGCGTKRETLSESPRPAPAESFFITGTDSPQPKCPNMADLVATDPSDEPKLRALVPQMVKALYTEPGQEEYTNVNVRLAGQAGVYGEMIENWCGAQVAQSSWVVGLTFPKLAPSASMSGGQFMVSKTRNGWQVWFRYH